MKRIPVRKGGVVVCFALVDDDDYLELMDRPWRLSSAGYAVRSYRRAERRRPGPVQMGRIVLGLSIDDPHETDHINRNRLDNRRENLRLATHAANSQNRKHAGGSSQYRGVTWNKACGKWQAGVKLRGHSYYLGLFDNEQMAADAARKFRETHMSHTQEEAA